MYLKATISLHEIPFSKNGSGMIFRRKDHGFLFVDNQKNRRRPA